MADSHAFEAACHMLETETTLERLEARGTMRLALKEAGLQAKSVSPSQLAVVVEKLLSQELVARGVADPGVVCARMSDALGRLEAPDADDAPESLFIRMGAG